MNKMAFLLLTFAFVSSAFARNEPVIDPVPKPVFAQEEFKGRYQAYSKQDAYCGVQASFNFAASGSVVFTVIRAENGGQNPVDYYFENIAGSPQTVQDEDGSLSCRSVYYSPSFSKGCQGKVGEAATINKSYALTRNESGEFSFSVSMDITDGLKILSSKTRRCKYKKLEDFATN